MARYRNALPLLAGGPFLTDGGIETTRIFHQGFDLPDFAAFHLLTTPKGQAVSARTSAAMRRSRSGSAPA
jgi:homocysteine S-methyltransferase